MIQSPHKRDTAIRAIVDQINRDRHLTLAAAKEAYRAAYPANPVPDYPRGGPVLPRCRYDDPTDKDPAPGQIIRRLGIFTEGVNKGVDYIGDDIESKPRATLEWLLLIPATHREEALAIREKGLAEIEASLYPCETRLEDPETGDLLAIIFEIGDPDFQIHDVGTAWVMAVYIPLLFTLDAATVLS